MKLTLKLFIILFALVSVAAIAIGIALFDLNKMDHNFNQFSTHDTEFLSNVTNVLATGLQRGQAMRNILLNPSDQIAVDRFEEASTASLNNLNMLLESSARYGLTEQVEELLNLTQQDIALQKEIIGIHNITEATRKLNEEETPLWRVVREKSHQLVQLTREHFEATAADISQQTKTSTNMVFVLLIVFIIIAGSIYLYFRKIITQPIIHIAKDVNRIASGDLTELPDQTKRKDEIGTLNNDFHKMGLNLKAIIHNIKETAQQVTASSQDLLSHSKNIADESDQIVRLSEEVQVGSQASMTATSDSAKAMEEMAIGIGRIAESATSVAESSNFMYNEMVKGTETIESTKNQMGSINASVTSSTETIKQLHEMSLRIGEIVSVITDIANQTNLLALNAAIEAARAGEHGKGFAVVADEVRKLAEMSGRSAEEIIQVIQDIQRQVERATQSMEVGTTEVQAGLKLMNEVEAVFEKLIQNAKNVTNEVSEVSAISEQMSAASEEVTASMQEVSANAKSGYERSTHVSEIIDRQALLLQQSSHSINQLSKLAEELLHSVEQFRI